MATATLMSTERAARWRPVLGGIAGKIGVVLLLIGGFVLIRYVV